MLNQQVIGSNRDMEAAYGELAAGLLACEPVDRGEVHAQKLSKPEEMMLELNHMTLVWNVDTEFSAWQETVKPNLPWAEDHFLERISGEPLNPPPSEAYWPFAQQGNAVHKKDEKFSHTYPERIWPKWASRPPNAPEHHWPIYGIRFDYGDADDLVEVFRKNPMTRQAYLPIWFPEDLAAAREGERVPCSLGYHFLQTAANIVDCTYSLRSCDFVRFFRDDVYMAGRLLHWFCYSTGMVPGSLVVHISNLHAFVGDTFFLQQQVPKQPTDVRASYNFDGMY